MRCSVLGATEIVLMKFGTAVHVMDVFARQHQMLREGKDGASMVWVTIEQRKYFSSMASVAIEHRKAILAGNMLLLGEEDCFSSTVVAMFVRQGSQNQSHRFAVRCRAQMRDSDVIFRDCKNSLH